MHTLGLRLCVRSPSGTIFLVMLFFLSSPMMPEPESTSSMEKQLLNFNIKDVTQNRATAFKRVGFNFCIVSKGMRG